MAEYEQAPLARASRKDTQPVPVRQTPTTPNGQSAFGDVVRGIASHGPRLDQSSGNPRHYAGAPLDKELSGLDRRRAGGLPPTQKTYIGPITSPEPSARVPESERRR